MATIVAEGTLTANGSEQVVATTALVGSFQFCLRLNNMLLGDTVIVRLKTKIGSGGTLRTVYTGTFSGAQVAPNIVQVGPPVPSAWDFEVTVQQTAGVNRAYDWRLDGIGALTVASSGSQSISNTTETTVYATATNGTFVFAVDLGAMTGVETLTLRLRTPVRSGGTQEVLYTYAPPAGAQVSPGILMLSIPASCAYGMSASIQQGHSNTRAYPFAIYEVAAAA